MEEELNEYMDRVFNGLLMDLLIGVEECGEVLDDVNSFAKEIDNMCSTLTEETIDKDNVKDLLLSAFDEVSMSKNCIKMLMKKELDSIMNSVYFKLLAVDYKITDISFNKKTISEEDRKYYSSLKDYVDVIKKQVCFISDENMWNKSYYRSKEMDTIEHLQERLKNILAKEKRKER